MSDAIEGKTLPKLTLPATELTRAVLSDTSKAAPPRRVAAKRSTK